MLQSELREERHDDAIYGVTFGWENPSRRRLPLARSPPHPSANATLSINAHDLVSPSAPHSDADAAATTKVTMRQIVLDSTATSTTATAAAPSPSAGEGAAPAAGHQLLSSFPPFPAQVCKTVMRPQPFRRAAQAARIPQPQPTVINGKIGGQAKTPTTSRQQRPAGSGQSSAAALRASSTVVRKGVARQAVVL